MMKQVLDSVCIDAGGPVATEKGVKVDEADESTAREHEAGIGEQVSVGRKRRLEEDGEEGLEDEKDCCLRWIEDS